MSQPPDNVQKRAGKPRSGCDTDLLRELHAQGMYDTAIAREMGKSPKTIRRYREKLGLAPNRFDPRTDNGPKNWDRELAKTLYDRGCSDTVIAQAVGVGLTTVYGWRTKNNLPAHYVGIRHADHAAELYAAGMSDVKIARELNVSVTAVRNWREKRGLGPHIDRKPVDYTEVRRLYESGMTDRAIAATIHCDRYTITKWRNEEGLPTQKYLKNGVRMPHEQLLAMWKNGATDREIAAAFDVTKSAVQYWRRKNNLALNPASKK